jgi:hypothetical protein
MVSMSDKDFPLPPPSFEFLVLSLRMQVETHLGMNPFVEEKTEPDFRLARHGVDLLNMLKDKTQNNLSMEEQRLLENTVTELRFRYVQAMDDAKKKSETPAQTPEANG